MQVPGDTQGPWLRLAKVGQTQGFSELWAPEAFCRKISWMDCLKISIWNWGFRACRLLLVVIVVEAEARLM